MFQIQIAYHATINSTIYDDESAANAAYEKISSALREYRMFKNDRNETVEVDTDAGRSTFRLDRMDSVTICKVETVGALDKISLEREKKLREMRKEMGLPETVRDPLQVPDDITDDVSAVGDSNG